MNQNKHVYVIFYKAEVACDVISSELLTLIVSEKNQFVVTIALSGNVLVFRLARSVVFVRRLTSKLSERHFRSFCELP